MSIHTILSQMEEFDKTMIELRRYFFSCGVMRVEPKPERLHEITSPLFSTLATRIVEEVGKELIGEDESPNCSHRSMNAEFVSTRNWLRKEMRTKLQKMKEI